MERLDSYKVNLLAMPSDTVSYRWQVGDSFFSTVQGPELQQGQLDVALQVKQIAGAFELTFSIAGTVVVACDRCLEPMPLPIHTERVLRARLGDAFADDGEVVTVPEDDGTLDVSWNIYEFIALEIPLRHVHPDGGCPQQVTQALSQDEPSEDAADAEQPVDPRWNELKRILDNNKK